ncbi:MAG: MotA/TolQ/ExbB proton channel family protein [Campylobacterales bacterium]|nr:MotA/TolQ/ExbB proton channel family protein [Campylobacterales bacterium]
MNLLEYIEKGGIIVYILLFINFIGFTIILWKFFTLPRKNKMIKKIKDKIDFSKKDSLSIQIEYEIKKLEFGLTFIKNIASIAPLMGLLGTVYGILKSFEVMSTSGLNDPAIFSSAISLALITTIAGLIVAIPHHLSYNHFISLIDEIELKAKKELL